MSRRDLQRRWSAVCPVPPLLDHISDVVVAGAEEQMGWVDAGRVVALVEHPQAVGDRAVVRRPREAMRQHRVPSSLGYPDLAVTLVRRGRRPQPAGAEVGKMGRNRAVLIDLRPEAIRERGASGAAQVLPDALGATEPPASYRDPPSLAPERGAADEAQPIDQRFATGRRRLRSAPRQFGRSLFGIAQPTALSQILPVLLPEAGAACSHSFRVGPCPSHGVRAVCCWIRLVQRVRPVTEALLAPRRVLSSTPQRRKISERLAGIATGTREFHPYYCNKNAAISKHARAALCRHLGRSG